MRSIGGGEHCIGSSNTKFLRPHALLTWRRPNPCAALRVGLLRQGSLWRRRRRLLPKRRHQALQRTQVQLRRRRCRCR